jgi:serine protease Do
MGFKKRGGKKHLMESLGKLFTGRSHTFSGRRRFQYCTVIRRTGSVLLVFAWLLLVVTACGAPLASRALIPVPAAPPMPTTTGYALGSPFSTLEGTLENTYAAVNPSVVNISVVQKEEVSYPQSPDFPFFGPSLPQGPQEQYRNGLGSGFVLDKEGHIVTNNHVVAGADTITVTFYDGTTAAGKVVGADPNSDLAVVKVEVLPDKLQPVQMGNSDQIKVGQLAIAIGNPFGLQSTMTVGIVSAVGRSLPVDSGDGVGASYTIPAIIQTDASINPGNSGGVLVDSKGRLIGVTSAIASPVQASAGIGFAIPSTIVQKVVSALVKTGHYDHPWLGAALTSLNPEISRAMNLEPDQRGALVVNVVPDSPALKGGLHRDAQQLAIEGQVIPVGGDVIIAIDGQVVKQAEDLIDYLERNTAPNQQIVLTILRGGKEQTLSITLAKRPTSGP